MACFWVLEPSIPFRAILHRSANIINIWILKILDSGVIWILSFTLLASSTSAWVIASHPWICIQMVMLNWIHHSTRSRIHCVDLSSAWIQIILAWLRLIKAFHTLLGWLIYVWIVHRWELSTMSNFISILNIQILQRLSATLPHAWCLTSLLHIVRLVVRVNRLVPLLCLVSRPCSIYAHGSLRWTLHLLNVVLKGLSILVRIWTLLAMRFICQWDSLLLLHDVVHRLVLL